MTPAQQAKAASAAASKRRTREANARLVRIGGEVVKAEDAAKRLGISRRLFLMRYNQRPDRRTWEGLK